MIDYTPLWETMKEKNISTYTLIRNYGFSKGTLDSLKQNRNVTLNTIEMLCRILQVPVEKVVRIIYDDIE
nr:helix-turn-helix transcriptional regulator [uncultured Blautia sp.]